MHHSATLIHNGNVIVIGGISGESSTSTIEIFDIVSKTWRLSDTLSQSCSNHAAAIMATGQILVAGGAITSRSGCTITSENYIYDPGFNYPESARPIITSVSPSALQLSDTGNAVIKVEGRGFRDDHRSGSEASTGDHNSSATNYPIVQIRRIGGDKYDSDFYGYLPFDVGNATWSSTQTQVTFPLGTPEARVYPAGIYALTVITNGIPSLPVYISVNYTDAPKPGGVVLSQPDVDCDGYRLSLRSICPLEQVVLDSSLSSNVTMTIDSVAPGGVTHVTMRLADPTKSGVFSLSVNGAATFSDRIDSIPAPVVSVVSDDCDRYSFDLATPCDLSGIKLDSALSENVSFQVQPGGTSSSARVTLNLNDREKPGTFALRVNDRIVLSDTMTGVNHLSVPWAEKHGWVQVYPDLVCDTLSFTITNQGQRPVVIESARALKNVEFTVPDDQFPLVIPPNYGSDTLKICFNLPKNLDTGVIINDSIIVQLPCVDIKTHIWAKRSVIDTAVGPDDCGTMIGLRSVKLSKPLVRSYPPVVDQQSTSATLRFEQIIPLDIEPAIITGALYDIFGTRIKDAEIINAARRDETDYSVENGTFELDLRNCPQGYYIVAITTPEGVVSYPISIVR
jgi:hypothetical protein